PRLYTAAGPRPQQLHPQIRQLLAIPSSPASAALVSRNRFASIRQIQIVFTRAHLERFRRTRVGFGIRLMVAVLSSGWWARRRSKVKSRSVMVVAIARSRLIRWAVCIYRISLW